MPNSRNHHHHRQPHRHHSTTEVAIVGNGPSGLALSAFLAGWHPYYVGEHPDPLVHSHLGTNREVSLLDQDLSWFANEGCAERLNPGVASPFSALYDCLVRPVAVDVEGRGRPTDAGTVLPSCLEWRFHPQRAVPHVVLGNDAIGGSWNLHDPEMLTVSRAEWMSLPGPYSMLDFLREDQSAKANGANNPHASGHDRVTANSVRRYLEAYARCMGLLCSDGEGNSLIRPHHATTIVGKGKLDECRRNDSTKESNSPQWLLEVNHGASSTRCHRRCHRHHLSAQKVVLAVGKSLPKRLGIEGESDSCVVGTKAKENGSSSDGICVYDLPSLKERVSGMRERDGIRQVVVVGDGVSAADAVTYCLSNGLQTLHVVKRGAKEMRNLLLARLSASIYPEYHRVYRLMTGREQCENYRCLTSANLRSIDSHELVARLEVRGAEIIKEPCTFAIICVGRVASLPFHSYCGKADYEFRADYQSTSDPTLFAVGSLAGDHFVRFLIGGCMQVAQTLIKQHEAGLKGAVVFPCRLSSYAPGHQCSPLYRAVKGVCRRYYVCRRNEAEESPKNRSSEAKPLIREGRILESIAKIIRHDPYSPWRFARGDIPIHNP